MAKLCPTCGYGNMSNALVCDNCGSEFTTGIRSQSPQKPERAQNHERAAILTQIYRNSLIIFVDDSQQPIIVDVRRDEILLGRSTGSDEVVDIDLTEFGGAMKGVSRNHARITHSPDGYMLHDLESTNGTWANGQKLSSNIPFILHSGDRIVLGQLVLHVFFRTEGISDNSILLKDSREELDTLEMTPDLIVSEIGVFLKAFASLQVLVDELLDRASKDLIVEAIIANGADKTVRIHLSGGSDAIDLMQNIISPWMQKNEQLNREDAQEIESLQTQLAAQLIETISSNHDNQDSIARYMDSVLSIIQALTSNVFVIVGN